MEEVERVEVWRKKRRALELRLAKVPYRAIAKELDSNVASVHQWVKELTAIDLPPEDMEAIRAPEADGYDASEARLLGLMGLVAEQAQRKKDDGLSTDAEVKQIESLERTLMDVRRQRALLLGINKPTLVKHNITVRNVLDEEIEALVSELSGGGNIMSDPELVDTGDDL